MQDSDLENKLLIDWLDLGDVGVGPVGGRGRVRNFGFVCSGGDRLLPQTEHARLLLIGERNVDHHVLLPVLQTLLDERPEHITDLIKS